MRSRDRESGVVGLILLGFIVVGLVVAAFLFVASGQERAEVLRSWYMGKGASTPLL